MLGAYKKDSTSNVHGSWFPASTQNMLKIKNTKLKAILLACVGISSTSAGLPRAEGALVEVEDVSRFVIPFIGTTRGGHVFPGATRPHGMIKVGMDTDSPENHAGYDANPKFSVTGFSQLHDSGTGGAIPLSNFKIWAFNNCTSFEECPTSLDSRKMPRKILRDGRPDDFASPGYFSTNLSNTLRVELTATSRAALHRYTFPKNTTLPRILVDITNDGIRSSTNQELILDEKTARVKGGAMFTASFGPGYYKAYTCVDFKGEGFELGQPVEWGAWTGFRSELGALFGWNLAPSGQTKILVRVGVSFINADKACANAEQDIPDFDFNQVQAESRAEWNELLGRIQVDTEGVPEDTVKLFYSSLYRTHISPADYTGENPHWISSEPYYDSLYCNWDTYRTLYPLMSLHDPETFARIVRGMIDIQRNEGWLPECRGATAQHWIQGGSNADPILAEFWVKFHDYAKTLNVSGDDLYNALLADAELQPPDWNLQGRQANTWKLLNYIPHDIVDSNGANSKQVSRTLEHAFGDFVIAQVAKVLGHTEDVQKYNQRATNYLNVWNPNVSVPDAPAIKGMMQPRSSNGTFDFTDPRHCSIHDPEKATCFLDAANLDGFYEGSPIIYSQYVPHDTARLVDLQGGADSFVERLDFIFENDYFESTDEPSQQMPYMYHYANRPGLSTQRSRQVIARDFNTSVFGLPGNDDSGAMGSYVAFYLVGLYPLPGTTQFLLSSPYFKEVSFFIPVLNKTTIIKANGFVGNPEDGTGGTVFVKSVRVNGEVYKSNCYLDWDVFVNGSIVDLELTDDINVTCGDGPQALPPSLSTGGYS
uniref:Glycoside hydrolase family 92 protein n=1 Tax=Moniliophthora roreri TaxID=221103 RepID=A0A0W0FVN3_MONRR